MRDLIIMRGCPGSGKSSAIKAAGLEAYTLSPDSIRLMLRAPELSIAGDVSVSQKDNALVFELMNRMLVNRKTFQSFKEILFDESMPDDIKLSKLDHINKRIGEKTPELFNKIKEQDSLFIQFLKEMNYDPNCNIIQLRELYNDYVDKRH